MIVLSLFRWWYSAGWLSAIEHGERRIIATYRLFSIPILLRTLASPWRRIITAPGAGIGAHIRAGVDNAISRLVGFIVRSIVLLTAGILLFFATLFSLIELLMWPVIPIAVLSLPFIGAIL